MGAERIRSIKPEIREDRDFGRMSDAGMVTAVLLLTVADDEGRFAADPELLASKLYPFRRSLDASGMLARLREVSDSGMIRLYTVDGEPFGDFPHWSRHQRVDHPRPSTLPRWEDGDREIADGGSREDSRTLDDASRTFASRALERDRDREGDRDHTSGTTYPRLLDAGARAREGIPAEVVSVVVADHIQAAADRAEPAVRDLLGLPPVGVAPSASLILHGPDEAPNNNELVGLWIDLERAQFQRPHPDPRDIGRMGREVKRLRDKGWTAEQLAAGIRATVERGKAIPTLEAMCREVSVPRATTYRSRPPTAAEQRVARREAFNATQSVGAPA